jgi:hypothetical protein
MSSLRPRLNAGGQGKPDQFGETARPHLVHDPRAVDLDGAGADLQTILGNKSDIPVISPNYLNFVSGSGCIRQTVIDFVFVRKVRTLA